MNTLNNSVRLIGHAGDDPKMVQLESGRKIANFSLATNETYIDNSGNRKSETTWHRLVAYGAVAETAEKLVRKGQEVAIEGKLNTRSWDDKEGLKHYTTEVIVDQMLMVGRKAEATHSEQC